VVTYYCFSWPDRPISLLLVPLTFTARWLLPLEFLLEFSGGAGNVSHAAHMCGVALGWLWFQNGGRNPFQGISSAINLTNRKRSKSRLKVVGKDDSSGGSVFH
jgi:membrane associated rhomboid family serine protease